MKTNFKINVLSHIEKDKIEPHNTEDKKLLQKYVWQNTLGNKKFVNVLKKLAAE